MELLGNDSDLTDVKFSINENYAQRYDKWRQGEELQRLKDKYGDDTGTESSSSEDEDEDARELTKDIEKNFFKTLSCLKEKNPKIYDQNVRFFERRTEEGEEESQKKKKKKSDHFYSLGEYQRNVLIEKEGQFSDEDDNEKSVEEMTNVEQEKAIKESFKDVLKDSESENEEEGWGGLFQKRHKTKEELKNEEEDYKLWLVGEKKKLKNSEEEKELKGLHDFWSDPTLDKNEQFLRDYILNKRFLEKEEKDRIPTYDEVMHDSDSGLSGDERTLQKQEEFERKFNFRFEEPDHEFIKRYPRTLEHSMRKKDDRRKKHREEVKARKAAEKAKKAEELKRLKALKRKEIMDKIQKLQEITGNEDMGFQKDDVEGEFDPEEHDKRMSELFNENYYGTCEDEEKPEYPGLEEELEIENWDEWGEGNRQEEEELHCEDPGFNMDCDYNPNSREQLEKELVESTKKRRRKRQSKFSAAVAKEKPVFDPKDKSFEKYIDEYYALDYEDLIGDLPCRFKYRKVVPNDFGLTVEEILAAPDKELNSWVSVKKIMQRRPEHVELYDVKAYRKKARDFDKKMKCLPSVYGSNDEPTDSAEETTKNENAILNPTDKKIKAKRKKPNTETKENNTTTEEPKPEISSEIQTKKKKKKNKEKINLETPQNGNVDKIKNKKNKNKSNQRIKTKFSKSDKGKEKNKNSQDVVYDISDSRLKSYGINPKKLKNKLEYGNKK